MMNNVFKLLRYNKSSSKRKLIAPSVYIIKLERDDTSNIASKPKV